MPKYQLKLTKTYELVKVEGDPAKDVDAEAYHLELTLQVTNPIRNRTKWPIAWTAPTACRSKGPGMHRRVQKTGMGLRDVVYQLKHNDFQMVACSELSEKDEKFRKDLTESSQFGEDHLPLFFGVTPSTLPPR